MAVRNNFILKEDFAIIYLNKKLYSKNVIDETINEFREIINVKLKEFENYFALRIEKLNNEPEFKKVSKEFLNYVLNIQFQRGNGK